MDEEKLILEVQNQPIIYDTSHSFYKDTNKKDAPWNAIAGAMGVDGKFVIWSNNVVCKQIVCLCALKQIGQCVKPI